MVGESFPQKLRELREAAGLTQKELADRVSISIRQISRLETAAQVATWPTVLSLCKALGVPCTAFEVEGDSPAVEEPARGPGRPRKAAGEGVDKPAPKKRARRKKT
jgi:transcriptional regulator with XRE-family HTH domain